MVPTNPKKYSGSAEERQSFGKRKGSGIKPPGEHRLEKQRLAGIKMESRTSTVSSWGQLLYDPTDRRTIVPNRSAAKAELASRLFFSS
jgi:hypothetical protein